MNPAMSPAMNNVMNKRAPDYGKYIIKIYQIYHSLISTFSLIHLPYINPFQISEGTHSLLCSIGLVIYRYLFIYICHKLHHNDVDVNFPGFFFHFECLLKVELIINIDVGNEEIVITDAPKESLDVAILRMIYIVRTTRSKVIQPS